MGGEIPTSWMKIHPNSANSCILPHQFVKKRLLDKSSLHSAGEHKVLNAYLLHTARYNAEADNAVRSEFVRALQDPLFQPIIGEHGVDLLALVLAAREIELIRPLDQLAHAIEILLCVPRESQGHVARAEESEKVIVEFVLLVLPDHFFTIHRAAALGFRRRTAQETRVIDKLCHVFGVDATDHRQCS